MILNYLIFSLFFNTVFVDKTPDPCDKIIVSVEIVNDLDESGKGRAEIVVKGAVPPVKYFFSKANGEVVNSDFSSQKIESLRKGKYTCLVKESGGCRKKIDFEIK